MCHTFSLSKKKVNALGKINVHADDKPGYFFKWPYIYQYLVPLFLKNNRLQFLVSSMVVSRERHFTMHMQLGESPTRCTRG